MINLGVLAVDAEANATITRLARTGGHYDAAGKWVPNAPASSSFTAVVQPATGRRLLDLPEGLRAEARYFLWTRSDLALADALIYGSERYKVIFLWPRPEGGYTRAALGLMKSA